MALENYLQADLVFKRGQALATCRLYYTSGGGAVNAATIVETCDAIWAKVSTAMCNVIVNSAEFTGVYAKWIGTTTIYEGNSTPHAEAGTGGAADPLPEEDAVVLQRRTDLRGRSENGRIFLPFVPETFALDSALTAAAQAKYLTLCTALGDIVGDVEGGEGPAMIPAHLNRKLALIRPVARFRLVPETRSRRDRREPKRVFAIASLPAGET